MKAARKKGTGIYTRKGTIKGLYKQYGLIDPRTDQIMYVGCTRQYLPLRAEYHIYEAKNLKLNSKKCEWINELLTEGLRPKHTTLEIMPSGTTHKQALERENYYIKKYGVTNKILSTFNRGLRQKTKTKVIDYNKIYELYDQGMRQVRISEKLLCCVSMVHYYIKKRERDEKVRETKKD